MGYREHLRDRRAYFVYAHVQWKLRQGSRVITQCLQWNSQPEAYLLGAAGRVFHTSKIGVAYVDCFND